MVYGRSDRVLAKYLFALGWILLVLVGAKIVLRGNPAFGSEEPLHDRIFCDGKRPISTAATQNPLLEKSPQENIQAHDVVILGEVLVPAKYCSIGICAGLRVHQVVKGTLSNNSVVGASVAENLLVRIKSDKKHKDSNQECLSEDIFTKKSQYWYVFAQGGTSKRGFVFYEVSEEGPSFATRAPIDFSQLEISYQKYRKELDDAIKSRFGVRY